MSSKITTPCVKSFYSTHLILLNCEIFVFGMKSILKLLANKYSITLVLFVLYNLFVNSIDIPFIVSSRWELHELRNQAETVKQENERVKEQLNGVKAKGYTLEKIAREQYFMKRSNEDVFVFKVAK